MSLTQFNNSICFDPERLEEAISQEPNAYDIIWNILFSPDHLQHKYPVSCQCALISPTFTFSPAFSLENASYEVEYG